MTYHLIALDIDGTTIDTGRPPSPRVLEALAAVQARGVYAVVATGRAFPSALEYAHTLNLHAPLICLQGALVKEQAGEQSTLLADCLPQAPLENAIRFADERALELTLYTESEIYVSRMRHSQYYYDLWFSLPIREVPDLGEAAGQLLCQGTPLVKALFIGEPEGLKDLEAGLNAHLQGSLDVVRSHAHFVELLAPGVSKGHALSFLAERLGVTQAETIAVGDSGNDISMIRWAGLGVAVANASPEVLASADLIVPSVSDDGVALVIERFILNQD